MGRELAREGDDKKITEIQTVGRETEEDKSCTDCSLRILDSNGRKRSNIQKLQEDGNQRSTRADV